MSCQCNKSHGGVTNLVICLLITLAKFNDSFDSPSRGFLFIIVAVSLCSPSPFTVLALSCFSFSRAHSRTTIFNFRSLLILFLHYYVCFSLFFLLVFLALHNVDFSHSTSLIKTRAWLVQIIWEILDDSVEYRTQSSLHIYFHFRRTSKAVATHSSFNFLSIFYVYFHPPTSERMTDQTPNDDYWRRSKERNENLLSLHNSPVKRARNKKKKRKVHWSILRNWRLNFFWIYFVIEIDSRIQFCPLEAVSE